MGLARAGVGANLQLPCAGLECNPVISRAVGVDSGISATDRETVNVQ